MPTEIYPAWDYFPRNARPPTWVEPFIANVRSAEQSVSTVERKTELDSDRVLQEPRGVPQVPQEGRRRVSCEAMMLCTKAHGRSDVVILAERPTFVTAFLKTLMTCVISYLMVPQRAAGASLFPARGLCWRDRAPYSPAQLGAGSYSHAVRSGSPCEPSRWPS